MAVSEILLGAGTGVVVSVLTAYFTARLAARQQLRVWRTEMVEKYAELVADQPMKAQALARQFALGVLVVQRTDPPNREKIFVAPNIRMVAGRDATNEIVLPSPNASRHHFAISADSGAVYVEDLGSANGTMLNGARVSGRTLLKSGDRLYIDNLTDIEFQSLGSNL